MILSSWDGMIVTQGKILIWTWQGDGAFICTNSWGEDFGDQGYFMYPILTAISVFIILYTQVWSRWTIMTTFTRVICAGWVGQIGYGQEEAWFANAYGGG